MGKILVFVILLVAIWVLVRGLKRARPGKREPSMSVENMVSCAYCDLNMPRSEAVPAGDRFYCCEEHRRLASR